MSTSLDTCMSDSDLDTRFPSLAYHKYCAKDMANRHRNIGSIALVRATFATMRSLRPYANTTQLRHIHELSTVASPMCSRARLVALPIAYPQDEVCPLVFVHTQSGGYNVRNVWFNTKSTFTVVRDDVGFMSHMATVAVQLICADASYGAEFKCLNGRYPTVTVEPNTNPVDRHSNQAHISFSSAINVQGPCRQRHDVDNSYLDVEVRVGIMLKLRGFICPRSSHDSHKAGYELLPTTCCCISRMSRLTSRPPPTVDVAQVDCGPLDVATMLSGAHQLIPIYVNGNLVIWHRVWISEFVKARMDFKAEVTLH